jgi:hypothetical protein
MMIFHRRHEVDLEQIDAQARQLIEAWLASCCRGFSYARVQ